MDIVVHCSASLLHAITWMNLTCIILSKNKTKQNNNKGIYTVLFHLDKMQNQLKLINVIKIQAQRIKEVKYFIQISQK